MAICSRCGRQTEFADEICSSCSDYANAASPVGAYSGLASHGSRPVESASGMPRARRYSAVDPGRRVQQGEADEEFAALPHFERPFAARRTVWPAVPEVAPHPASLGSPDHDLAANPPEQLESGQPDPVFRTPDQDGMPRREEMASGAGDRSLPPVQIAELPRNGRWIALTAAMAVLLLAAGATATLAARHDLASQSGRIDKPSVTATPSSSAAASVAPTGQNQLSVGPAAAAAPDEASILATLNRYFDAINNHDYLIYKRTFILALRGGISPASFSAGFGTTTESGEQLRSINVIGEGQADAFVTSVSRQATAGKPNSLTCAAWSMEFFLGQRGSRYLLIAPPLWNQVSNSSCP